MSALTTAAIIGLAAASAGSAVASSAIQAHQTGKAVDAQTEAGNKALGLQQQQYQAAQQNSAPYQALGQSSLGRLGQMASAPQAQFNPSNYSGGVPTSGQPMPSQQMPGQQTLGAPPAAPMPGMPPAGAGQNDTVTIQTPDGRTLSGFPRAKVQEAMQRGAKVIG